MQKKRKAGIYRIVCGMVSALFLAGLVVSVQARSLDRVDRIVDRIREVRSRLSVPLCKDPVSGQAKDRVSFDFDNVALGTVLDSLAENCGIETSVEGDVLRMPIRLRLRHVKLELAFSEILRLTGLEIASPKLPLRSGDRLLLVGVRNNLSYRGGPISRLPLRTEFLPFRFTRFSHTDDSESDGKNVTRSKLLIKDLAALLCSRSGTIEFEPKDSTLIITDVEVRMDFVSSFVKFLNDSDFSLEEVLEAFDRVT